MNKEKQYTFSIASATMTEALKNLWEEAFGDERSYIDFFFLNRFRPAETVVCLDGQIPVGVSYCLPVSLFLPLPLPREQSDPYLPGKGNGNPDGAVKQSPALQEAKARYIYAVAVKKEYRRQGIAAELLRFAHRSFAVPLILEPADDHLLRYYERLGFEKAFYVDEYELSPETCLTSEGKQTTLTDKPEEMYKNPMENKPDISIHTCTPESYRQIRDARFHASGYVQWDEQAIAYALKENEYCGGKAYEISINDRREILLLRPGKDAIHILETTLTDQDLYQVLKHLGLAPGKTFLRRNPAFAKSFSTSASPTENPTTRCIGLLYGREPARKTTNNDQTSQGYLNLTLE